MDPQLRIGESSLRTSRTDTAWLVAISCTVLTIHLATNHQYGFHRDELATVNDAKNLAWGYVAYPPVTPFFGRISLALFGDSLRGIRLFPTLTQSIAIVVAGIMARLLGGNRFAQMVAALAVAAAPVSLAAGSLYQYVAFDYLWWVLTACFVIKLIASEDPRWFIAIGTTVGLGLMTKYSMLFFAASLVLGILLTSSRRLLKSRWFVLAILIGLVIILPNLIWQARHHFISLEFLKFIHARDVRIGRTSGFLPDQFLITASPLTIPLWIAGLLYYFIDREGRRFAAIGWMYVITLGIFIVAKGRGYYLAPAYPMLLAAGAVWTERCFTRVSPVASRFPRPAALIALLAAFITSAAVTLPIAPVGSRWFASISKIDGDFVEEIGWPDLVAEVARVYNTIPQQEREQAGILALNYGEAGAIDLFGSQHELPKPMSGTNSYWYRGYGNAPQTVVVIGGSRKFVDSMFQRCELAGHNTNRYGVLNEETKDHPDIFLCRDTRKPWAEIWPKFQRFG